ncbi:MAG TPA: ATP-binding protein [Abditibacteriaceae bacterium]|nr:ATP-binding protein [Abditibacteriaceae bacterium]
MTRLDAVCQSSTRLSRPDVPLCHPCFLDISDIINAYIINAGIMDNSQDRFHFRQRVRQRVSSLLQHTTKDDDFVEGLVQAGDELLSLTGASGAVLFFDERAHLVGTTPTQSEIRELVQWLHERDQTREQPLWQTVNLAIEYSKARHWNTVLPGLLAISLSQVHRSHVLWFRREQAPTPVPNELLQLSQDKSQDASTALESTLAHAQHLGAQRSDAQLANAQLANGNSATWQTEEIEAADELRGALCVLLLKRAEETAQLAQELAASNRELESFAHSVSHDLRAPLRHISGFAALLHKRASVNLDETSLHYLNTIGEAARKGGVLVDNLLGFSRMSRSEMSREAVDMNALVNEVQNDLAPELQGRDIQWKVDDLPIVRGDREMLSLALRNLLGNAVKYTSRRAEALVEIGCLGRDEARVTGVKDEEAAFFIRDNGAGFDMQYVDKIFGVFQRLHALEEFEGTGIGLANVQRIIARHGGRVWAQGEIDRGATIFFSLPRRSTVPEDENHPESSTR